VLHVPEMHQRLASPGPLFHTTNNQSFHPTFTLASDNRYSMQLLLGHFFWFRITCGGNLLPSANTCNISVTQVTYTGLEKMTSDVVSLGKFPCFIFYCLTSKWYSAERFLSLLASARFLHCHTFPFTMRNFLAASQLAVFWV